MKSAKAKSEIRRQKIGLPYFLFSLFYFLAVAPAGATTVSGTFKRPDGTPINGTVEFVLSQQAKTTTPPVTFAPVLTTCPVTNGDISPGCTVQGNDTLDPAGTFYRVRVLDLNNTVVIPQLNYTLSGAAVNLGELPVTATDTLVPPTGSVTGNMNVTGNLTVGGAATFGADPQNFAHLRLLGATSDPASAAAGSVFHRSDLNTIRFRAGGIEIFDGSQYLPLFASSSQTLDLNASLRIPGGGSATFMRLNQLRLVDPDLWLQSGVTAKIDAAVADCFGAECRVVLPTNLSSGSPTRSSWPETSALLDLRGDEPDPFTNGAYYSPFKTITRKTTDTVSAIDLFAQNRCLVFHDSGGDNAGGGPKDTYFCYRGDLYSAGRGQHLAISGKTFQYGSGDAVGAEGVVDYFGNCLETGGECSVGLRTQSNRGSVVFTGTVSTYTGGSRTIAYSSPTNEATLGVDRVIINTSGAKTYTTGSITSINSASPPVVTGTGTAWVTQFGSGAHTDLCFSQTDDDSSGGLKFVVPIRSIDSETSLTLDYDPQAVDRAWPGDNNGSTYRIYKCALVETINFAGGSFTHATGGTTDWAATDTIEVPVGWAYFGNGLSVILTNNLPSHIGNGLDISNGSSEEPVDRLIHTSGKASLGLQFDNTWQCRGNNANCTLSGFTTGVRFQNPPTVGLHYATTVSGANTLVRINDQFGSSAGNLDIKYHTTAESLDIQHDAATANVIQLLPTIGQIIADSLSIRSTGRVQIGANPAATGGLRLSNNNSIRARNAANSADIVMTNVSASDRVVLSQSGTPVEFAGGVYSNGGGFKHARLSTGSCGTSGCQVTVSWTTAFADTNYSVNCSVQDATAQSETTGLRLAKINSIAAGSVTVDLDNLSASAVTGTLHCVAVHD